MAGLRRWVRWRSGNGRRPGGGSVRLGDDGFSLVEVLVSIAIIGLVMTALSRFYVGAVAITAQQGERQVAVQLGVDGLENVRALKGSTVRSNLAVIQDAGPILRNGIPYTRNYTADDCWQADSGGACGDTHTDGAAGFFRVRVTVTWSGRSCGPPACSYTVSTLISNAPDDPVFNVNGDGDAPTVTIPGGTDRSSPASTPVSFQLLSSGGTAPMTWRSSGVPDWLTVSSDGRVTGTTPSTQQTVTGTFSVSDAFGQVGSASFTWAINAAPPRLAPVDPQTSTVGTAVTLAFADPGGSAPLAWSAVGLPPGLAIDAGNGSVSGTPTDVLAAQDVTVTVTDGVGRSDTVTFTWTVQ